MSIRVLRLKHAELPLLDDLDGLLGQALARVLRLKVDGLVLVGKLVIQLHVAAAECLLIHFGHRLHSPVLISFATSHVSC